MRQYTIQKDIVYDLGEVPYLGVPYDRIQSKEVGTLPENYDGWFPFMRMCYSLGDLGITSGIFEALKQKYPAIKIAWPSNAYIEKLLGSQLLGTWGYGGKTSWEGNIEAVMANNPHIDKIFNAGEFDIVFTDHDRSYTSLVHDGDMVRSCDEPLAEQILRRFGFTDSDFKTIDVKPKLYFTQEEVEEGEALIQKHVGNSQYGCLILASRFKKTPWEGEEYLFQHVEDYKGLPLFYYSENQLEGTKWQELFPTQINFAEVGLTLRQQMYIKHRALFNVGYQAGVTDACSGGNTQSITLCPFPTIRENCVRGGTYVFPTGDIKVIQ